MDNAMPFLRRAILVQMSLLLIGVGISGCSSLSLSEMQTPRTMGKGDFALRGGFDYGPSLSLFYENDSANRIHRVPRAVLPPARVGVLYGITDRLDVGADLWTASYWSALAASPDIGGRLHCKYMITSPASRHGLAIGLSGFAYTGIFVWGQENPVEASVKGRVTGFNPLLLYGFRIADHPLGPTELYAGLRGFFIDYHVEGDIEHFRSDPPPLYEEHDGTARLISPIIGLQTPGKDMQFFIEGGAFFGRNPLNDANMSTFTVSIGLKKWWPSEAKL